MCVKTIKRRRKVKIAVKYFIICYKILVGFDFTLPQFSMTLLLEGKLFALMIRLMNQKVISLIYLFANISIGMINGLF